MLVLGKVQRYHLVKQLYSGHYIPFNRVYLYYYYYYYTII